MTLFNKLFPYQTLLVAYRWQLSCPEAYCCVYSMCQRHFTILSILDDQNTGSTEEYDDHGFLNNFVKYLQPATMTQHCTHTVVSSPRNCFSLGVQGAS